MTLMAGYKLRMFNKRVLRRISGPRRDGVTGGWIRLHNEELHNLSSSPSIIRTIMSRRISNACSTNGGRGTQIGCWWESREKLTLM
jgi:muramidase (phage lysozyme)